MIFRRIELLCSQRGMTLQQACLAAGLSRSSWCTWRRGVVPSARTLTKLAKVLNTSAGYLRYGPSYAEVVEEDNIYVKELLDELTRMDKDECRKLLSYARQINSGLPSSAAY